MKRFLTLMVCLVAIATAYGQNNYYWYYNEQIPLIPDDSQYFIVYDNQEIGDIINDNDNAQDVVNSGAISLPTVQILTSKSETYKKWKWALISKTLKESIENNHQLIYTANSYKMEDGTLVGVSNFFYVKLRNEDDVAILKEEAEKYGVDVIGYSAPLWYVLMCTNNENGNAVVMANIFKETNLFAASEPNLMSDITLNESGDDIVPREYQQDNKTGIEIDNIESIIKIDNNSLNIKIDSNLLGNTIECALYDTNGKLKLSKDFPHNTDNIYIDLTTLLQGIYICVVQIDGNKIFSFKFVK